MVSRLHMMCRAVDPQGSTRSQLEQESEGTERKGFDDVKDFPDNDQWI